MRCPISIFTAILVIVFPLTSCKDSSTAKQKQQEKDAMAEFERSAREMRAEQARELDSEEGIRNDPKKLDRLIDATKKLEDASKGDEAKMAKVMNLFLKDIQQDMAVMAKHQKHLRRPATTGISNHLKKSMAFQKR